MFDELKFKKNTLRIFKLPGLFAAICVFVHFLVEELDSDVNC